MQGVPDALPVSGPVKLSQNDRCSGAETCEKAVENIYQRPCGSHRRKSFRADETPYDNGVHRVIHLLEKSPQQNGKEEGEDLLPDDPFRNLFCGCFLCHSIAS